MRDGSAHAAGSAGSAGPLSRALPVTSSRRPSTGSPTGTLIGPPVARTATPRFRPAVACKRDAAHRVLVEMRLHLDNERVGLIPFDDEGFIDPRQAAPSKATSTTARRTAVTMPVWVVRVIATTSKAHIENVGLAWATTG